MTPSIESFGETSTLASVASTRRIPLLSLITTERDGYGEAVQVPPLALG